MRIASEVTIKRIEDDAKDKVPKSEVLVHGRATGKFVSGALLEVAVSLDGRYLLFTTDDCPFEEVLKIHLLDAELTLLDSAVLGAPYSTGSFSSLRLEEPDKVHFRFMGDCEWTVTVLPRRGFRFPLLSGQLGVWRRIGFSKYFVVSGDPKPD